MCSFFAKAVKQRDTYPFWPYCASVVLPKTRVCQCPEHLLERASDHMDSFHNNNNNSLFTINHPQRDNKN